MSGTQPLPTSGLFLPVAGASGPAAAVPAPPPNQAGLRLCSDRWFIDSERSEEAREGQQRAESKEEQDERRSEEVALRLVDVHAAADAP